MGPVRSGIRMIIRNTTRSSALTLILDVVWGGEYTKVRGRSLLTTHNDGVLLTIISLSLSLSLSPI